jgi:acetylornithine deacetylase/succinyl-diaminopimelate desuccinylase-like protein
MTQFHALQYLEENYDRFQSELIELLRIPSISHDPAYKQDMDKAAGWLAAKLGSMGMSNVEIFPTEGHSLVYGDWLHGGPSSPTVLVYGHYDVQSPEPLADWKTQPFEPEIRNGNLYARGASDMKGQTLASLNAVEAIVKAENLPINIRLVIEGEEEIGSKHFNDFLIAHRQKLIASFSLNTDAGGMPDADTPSICYSLRGGASFVLEIFGPRQDIHSGEFGGAIQNPIHVLSKVIASLHDEHGHITLPGFYDQVRKIDEEEHAELSRLPFDESFLLQHSGAPAIWGEPEYLPAERIGARPTFDVLQFEAGQPKSAIPARATARLSFRLVPDQDPVEVHRQLRSYLEENLPPTVTWNLGYRGGGQAVITDRHSPEVAAMKDALQAAFGRRPIVQRAGGGIGAVLMLKQTLGIDSVLTGFSLFDDNIHGPNEKLHLPAWKKGIAALIHFFHRLADR